MADYVKSQGVLQLENETSEIIARATQGELTTEQAVREMGLAFGRAFPLMTPEEQDRSLKLLMAGQSFNHQKMAEMGYPVPGNDPSSPN